MGGFLTNPVDTAISIGDILKFINGNFPIKVLIQEDDTNRSQVSDYACTEVCVCVCVCVCACTCVYVYVQVDTPPLPRAM